MSNTIKLNTNNITRKLYYYRANPRFFNSLFDLFNNYNTKLDFFKDNSGTNFDNLKDTGLLLGDASDKNRFYFLDIKYISSNKIQCILYSLRDAGFPYLFDLFTGNKREIDYNEYDTIMDQTHFTVYPKSNIIVTEFNYFGCRLEKLPFVLSNALKSQQNLLDISPILNVEASNSLINSEKFKGFSIKASYPAIKELKRNLGLGALDDLNNNFVNTENLIVDFSLSENNGLNLTNPIEFLGKIVTFVNNVKLRHSDEHGFMKKESPIKKAKITKTQYGSRKSLTVDLLEDKLISEVFPIKLNRRSKYIDSDNMFAQIDTAFDIRKCQIVNDFDVQENSSLA